MVCAQCPCPLRCVAFDTLRGYLLWTLVFIPAFVLAENYYSLVQSSGLREEGSAHKTAMFIFGSPASSVAQTPSAASRAALGFFEPTLALHAGSHTTTSDFGKPAAGDGRCITRGFSEHLKLTLTALFQRISDWLVSCVLRLDLYLYFGSNTRDHHRTPSSASSETVLDRIYHF